MVLRTVFVELYIPIADNDFETTLRGGWAGHGCTPLSVALVLPLVHFAFPSLLHVSGGLVDPFIFNKVGTCSVFRGGIRFV